MFATGHTNSPAWRFPRPRVNGQAEVAEATERSDMKKVEYKVRPITRYVITRYEEIGNAGRSEQRGVYDNGEIAYQVAYALCKMEHDQSGEPVGSTNFIYPSIPEGVSVMPEPIF